MFKVFIAIASTAFILSICPNNANARSGEFTKTLAFENNWKVDTTPKPKRQVTNVGSAKIGGETGKITGKILNSKTGDPIVGASVTIKSGYISRSVKTDYNGIYTVSELPEGTYSITISHITFGNKQIDDVKIVKKDVTTQDITMAESKGKNLDEVVVTSKGPGRIKESVASLLIQQKNAASVSDGISAEAIKRTPDKNTSDIMKRVSGASIQDDRFVIIRGLNDRYNAAFINNSPLPSSESDRKAFSFDVFPANMLDNLIIVKTATPDMNADFVGGTIFINTKDIPAKSFQSITIGTGFNTVATFKDRKFDTKGKWDWIGLDDGTRKLPAEIPTTNLKDLSAFEKGELGKKLKNNWGVNSGKTPLNYNFQFSKGINIQKNKKDFFGILLAATYNKSYKINEGENNNYVGFDGTKDYESKFATTTYTSEVLAGLMCNMAVKINSNNKVSFKNLISINSDDKVIERVGYRNDEAAVVFKSSGIWFTSNQSISSQLNGEHFWVLPKIKFNWNGGYTSVNRQIPYLRKLGTIYDPSLENPREEQQVTLYSSIGNPESSGSSFISSTKENIKNASLDMQRLFKINNNNSILLKSGVYYQQRQRDFSSRYLTIARLDSNNFRFDDSLIYLTNENVFNPQNFGILSNGKLGFGLNENFNRSNTYDASSSLLAYYLMVDMRFLKFIRLNGGMRVEKFDQILNSYTRENKPVNINTTLTDILPSTNLIISLNSKQNLRFSYSQTLNRPEYRELAPFVFEDYVTRLALQGVPDLQRVKIDNFDFRYEFYPSGGQILSASFFQKNLPNPIEFVINTSRLAKNINSEDGKVQGIELEARATLGSIFNPKNKTFLSNTTIFGNFARTWSTVSFGIRSREYGEPRSLQGQSPYTYNAGVTYQDQLGYGATVQINYAAPRLQFAGDILGPSILENGRKVVDLQLSKTFLKNNVEFKLNIRDLLANDLVRFFDMDNNGYYDEAIDKTFLVTKYGRIISAAITYKF